MKIVLYFYLAFSFITLKLNKKYRIWIEFRIILNPNTFFLHQTYDNFTLQGVLSYERRSLIHSL